MLEISGIVLLFAGVIRKIFSKIGALQTDELSYAWRSLYCDNQYINKKISNIIVKNK